MDVLYNTNTPFRKHFRRPPHPRLNSMLMTLPCTRAKTAATKERKKANTAPSTQVSSFKGCLDHTIVHVESVLSALQE